MLKYADVTDGEFVGETDKYQIVQVRWPVLFGVHGEGLLLKPKGRILANVIALPDADQIPEDLVGLSGAIGEESHFGRHLAENGFQVLIPLLISRDVIDPTKLAGRASAQTSKLQTHREWIYRQAFHMGRHIIGYEVQKVQAAVSWFERVEPDLAIGLVGYGEGGLIAFYTAAIDRRIDAVMTSGYFTKRSEIWDEPIYRQHFWLFIGIRGCGNCLYDCPALPHCRTQFFGH